MTTETSSGARRHSFYSPETNLLSETYLATGTPLIEHEYVWFGGQPVCQLDYGFVNQTNWTFTDHLGTPLIQTDGGGNIVWRAEYEPYGRVFALRTPNRYQPLRLPGQEAQETNVLSADGNGASERFLQHLPMVPVPMGGIARRTRYRAWTVSGLI